ncbi:4-amino-4-deoxy-L-arabinose transferase [Aeromicrobium sp.]|uniref:4-amino-4-deoxy-L-arabinose transferase n=1 Tax=Aeromicrobium sp. TaxID=1871063 RepID=UPI0030BA810E
MPSHRYDDIVTLIASRQPVCGSTKVVAVDGPSGAGKTDLVAGLAAVTGATVLHLDDIYPGWHGLAATPPMIAGVLGAIAVGEIGSVHRWSWVRDRPGPLLRVAPAPLLILDGVGSGAGIIRPHLSALLWLEAPAGVRKRRALARDGDTYRPFWDVWAAQESRHFAAEQTRRHADIVIQTDA